MTDADLIYNALLRAEKKVEAFLQPDDPPEAQAQAHLAMGIIQTIREEIGNGLAERARNDKSPRP